VAAIAPVGQLWQHYKRAADRQPTRGAYEEEGTAIHTRLLPQAERAAGEGIVRRSRASASIAERPRAEARGDL